MVAEMSAGVLIIILLICAGAFWLVNYKYPQKVVQPFKFLINCVIVGVAFYYFLVATGLWEKIFNVKVPHV